MNPQKNPLDALVRIALGALLILSSGLSQAMAESPTEVVRETSNAILTEIHGRRAEFEASNEALDAFVRDRLVAHIDQTYSARLVLGLHGRSASREQIEAFAGALSDSLMRRYGRALLEVEAGTQVKVSGEVPVRDGKIIRVNTLVDRAGGAPIPVDYMMRPGSDGKWRAFDVIVEGVSYVQTFRAQFDEPIRKQGLDRVIEDLRANRIELDVE